MSLHNLFRFGPSLVNSYIVTVAPTIKPISLDEVKEQLHISCNDTSDDLYFTLLIDAVTTCAETYTQRTFINTTFKTYRDRFMVEMVLTRSKLQSVTSVSFLKDDVLTPVDSSIFSFTDETDFGRIFLKNGESWPSDVDFHPQAIVIIFVAGFGPSASDVPEDLKLAMKNHIASLYANRGDCSDDLTNEVAKIPNATKFIYDKYVIKRL